MVLVGGRASVRNRAETFGLERELMGRWENSTTHGGPVRLVKGQVVIVDDAVDHNAPGGREPPRTTGSTATPTGGSRGPSSSRSP
ncbi:hypothetical protein MetMK1DRAFT_00016540 [Metallosphaera yellowstonensis MK1]|uniref:Uncharacterized protein n=1 Tax=Metallosphaera yellowstonensis MK1 TaxID=671065 RepID=H2C154_9CREN|nr:hypothetical protein [Metallosphaera yellowstonensis]EHP71150.1 hypothetical protein MetMK1DRAFT_00016540 [Metallosphaera yellowstonensis MK1]